MSDQTSSEERLWLVRGGREAPGWQRLEADAKARQVKLVIFDRDASWALVRAVAPPTQYEGMAPEVPRNGLYVSEHGYPIYVVAGQEVFDPKVVVRAAGPAAEAMLEELGDPITVIERMGLAY
jgi:hypothetical protein